MNKSLSFKGVKLLTRKGVALLLVLTVITVLAAVVVEFAYTTRVGMNLGATYRDSAVAESISKSGIEIAKKLLLKDLEDDKADSDMVDFVVSEEEMPTDDEPWSQAGALAQLFNPFQSGGISLKIADEGGKFNVNMLVGMDGSRDENMVRLALKLFDALNLDDSEGTINRIVDWLDADSDGEWENAAKNSQMESLTELGLLPGIDYLRYINITGIAVDLPVFSNYLTVYPQRRYVEGVQQINWQVNINTAPVQVIMAIVKDAGEDAASAIFEDISQRHMNSAAEFTNYLSSMGLELEPGVAVSVRSDTFSVVSEGIVGGSFDDSGVMKGGVSSIIRAVLQRSEGGKVDILYWREE